ncbi:DNA-directed RNA polymerase III subunit RPC8-like [Clavelina lepadiformis]|uniref:DNA-directed RNA polymerase III subunit RPC8 n=1 Tax=Clavelina lepadiformis TaxID=159417 RepID=A0ABP0H1H1_CLALP
MFTLVSMVDTIKIPPWLFNVTLDEAVKTELNRRFANKVIYNVGLCICLFDILKFEDSFIFPGDGASHTKVHFRYVVFRPFMDEVLTGKIKGCSSDSVTISLGFFDDIVVPPEGLQQPSKFDDSEQVWVWEYETEEGTHDLFMDINEPVRFRVVDEVFVDTTPASSGTKDANISTSVPYSIKAIISEPGLGLLSWWTNK